MEKHAPPQGYFFGNTVDYNELYGKYITLMINTVQAATAAATAHVVGANVDKQTEARIMQTVEEVVRKSMTNDARTFKGMDKALKEAFKKKRGNF